jgi:hypothetical protein
MRRLYRPDERRRGQVPRMEQRNELLNLQGWIVYLGICLRIDRKECGGLHDRNEEKP